MTGIPHVLNVPRISKLFCGKLLSTLCFYDPDFNSRGENYRKIHKLMKKKMCQTCLNALRCIQALKNKDQYESGGQNFRWDKPTQGMRISQDGSVGSDGQMVRIHPFT